jgi:hypothetical protein
MSAVAATTVIDYLVQWYDEDTGGWVESRRRDTCAEAFDAMPHVYPGKTPFGGKRPLRVVRRTSHIYLQEMQPPVVWEKGKVYKDGRVAEHVAECAWVYDDGRALLVFRGDGSYGERRKDQRGSWTEHVA